MRSPAASAVWHYLNEPFLELLDTRNCCVSALADTIVTLGWPRFSTTETRLTGRPMKAHGPTATYCSDVCRCRYREPSIRMPMPRCDGQPRETQPANHQGHDGEQPRRRRDPRQWIHPLWASQQGDRTCSAHRCPPETPGHGQLFTPGHNACEPFNRVRGLLLQDLSGPAASPHGGEHHERSDGHGRQRRDTLQDGPAATCAGGIRSGALRRRAITPVGSARTGTLESRGGNVQAVR
jgi:hypothetical protein